MFITFYSSGKRIHIYQHEIMENMSTESVSVWNKLKNYNENDEEFLKECWIAIKVIPVILLTLVTLIGNGLVIVMFARSKQLRKCKNIYIVSLAMADFLIGCTMPVFILEEIGLSLWILQGTLCRVFLMFRYSLFYISLLSIMLISVDRWWSINHPFSYRVKQSRKLALWSVLCSWLLSFAIYAPPILGWEEVIDNSANDGVATPSISAAATSATPQGAVTIDSSVPGVTADASINQILTVTQCRAPFENNLIFNLLTAIVLYLIPLIALWIMNASIYFKISQRKGMKIRRSLSTSDTFFLNYRKSSSESDNMGQFDEFIDAMIPAIYRKAGNSATQTLSNGISMPYSNEDKRHSLFLSMRRTPLCQSMATAPSFAQYARINQKRHVSFDANGMFLPGMKQKRLSSFILAKGGSTSSNSSSSSSSSSNCSSRNGLAFRRQSDDLVKDMFVKQDKKAACSLGVLVLVFTLCWTPHTVCSIIKSSYGTWYIPSILLTVSYCILATNSAINPFLYGLCNSDFRKAFRSWCRNRKSKQRRFEEALLYYGLPQVYEPEIIPEQSTSTPTKEPKDIP